MYRMAQVVGLWTGNSNLARRQFESTNAFDSHNRKLIANIIFMVLHKKLDQSTK